MKTVQKKGSTPKNPSEKNYQKLFDLSRSIHHLMGIRSHLDWDQETYMPPEAANARSEQLKILTGIIHKEKTGSKFTHALKKLIDLDTGHILVEDLDFSQKSALKEWLRDYRIATALPQKFVEDFAKTTSQAIIAWRTAKEENAFNKFAPFLEKIVRLSRKKAEYLGYKEHPYDALLDLYEPGITTKEISTLFEHLKSEIVPLVEKIKQKPPKNDSALHGDFELQKQLELGNEILHAMGYDFNKGRVDLSSHPFSSSSHPTDSRITTRIHSTYVMSNLSVILHEGGQSLYDMGLPIEQFGSPLGESISYGMHECQARWWETRIGQSLPFWTFFYPKLQQTFKPKLDRLSLEEFYQAFNRVSPSFIRVDADEVTYPLHIILRFELEKGLIEGSINVRDIPKAWDQKMGSLLGISPSTNREGCLQDIHWAMGGFGYFPSYTLGNIFASHLFTAFEKTHPKWQNELEKGNLIFIKEWLKEHVYKYGKTYSSKGLLEKITGKPVSAHAYIGYLKEKYCQIYQI